LSNEIVKNWFDQSFSSLAPELQELHLNGGALYGEVEVIEGNALAGLIGRRVAKKLGIPTAGTNTLRVNISHDEQYLHWDRQFNETTLMQSRFQPIGTIENGHWVEKSGSLELVLTVEVIDHGWHWRCIQYKYRGIPIPLWLFPSMRAYKNIENGGYRFYVGFSLPLVGLLFSYSGVLNVIKSDE